MTIVSSLQGTRVQEFWKGFLPTEQAQNPILWHRKKAHPTSTTTTWHPASYKDLNAQAHCAAAFFMARGLRKGDTVAILSRQGFDCVVLDIALQFIGAVNLSLPHDSSLSEVTKACDNHNFRFIYYSDVNTYQSHKQLEVLKPRLKNVLISGEDVDDIDPDKVVTFDRVIGLGKIDWREETQQLIDLKAAVLPTDLYAMSYNKKKGIFDEKMTFNTMIDEVTKSENQYTEAKISLVLSALTPDRLHQKLSGIYPALRLRTKIYLLPAEKLEREHFAELRPHALLTDVSGVEHLFESLPAYVGEGPAVEKAFSKAHAIVARRDEALAQGKKNPFMNRMRYRSGNRKLYRKVLGQLGGQLKTILCEAGSPAADATLFFSECGINIVS